MTPSPLDASTPAAGALLGLATTRQLLSEVRTRIRIHLDDPLPADAVDLAATLLDRIDGALDYRTVDHDG